MHLVRRPYLARVMIVFTMAGLLVLYAAADSFINGFESDANKLELCYRMCKGMFGEGPNPITNCTHIKNGGEYVECHSLGSSSGPQMVRLSCHDMSWTLFSKCAQIKTPSLTCKRIFDNDTLVNLTCSWQFLYDSQDCEMILSWPTLFSLDLKSSYLPVSEPSCNKENCTATFSYPRKYDLQHCPSDKLSVAITIGTSAIRGTIIYQFDRLENFHSVASLDIGQPKITVDKNKNFATVEFVSKQLGQLNDPCILQSEIIYCLLEMLDGNNVTGTILYAALEFADTKQNDGLTRSTAFCQFEYGDISNVQGAKLRLHSSAHDSEPRYVSFATKVTRKFTTMVPQPMPAPSAFFAVAALVLASPALCGLILCCLWARRRCSSPCLLYKNCVAKKKLRRTADWVVLVQTNWHQKRHSENGLAILDQPSSPASQSPENARSERTTHWDEFNELDEELAPSLKRPLMNLAENEFVDAKTFGSPVLINNQSNHESISLSSSITDTWFSDTYKSAKAEVSYAESNPKELEIIEIDSDNHISDKYSKIHAGEASTEDCSEMHRLIEREQRCRRKSLDEASFVTASEIEPKNDKFH